MTEDIRTETQQEAHQAGRKKYRTGKRCIHGHDSPRYVSNTGCCECADRTVAKNRRKNKPVTMIHKVHPADSYELGAYAIALNEARKNNTPEDSVTVIVKVPSNQVQALRNYAAILRES